MRRLAAVAFVTVLLMSACGKPGPGASESSEADPARLMALALTDLVTENHTFGDGPPPFTEYLIESNTVPVDVESGPTNDTSRPLTEDERAAIEESISEFGPVRWIDDPDDWRSDDLQPVIDGMAILGVDAPILDEEGALVGVSLWCGGLCGTWFTYRLEQIDGAWRVTGIEGPIAIS